MNTNQLPAILNDYSEAAAMVDLTGACIHCTIQHTTCAQQHPTAAQRLAIKNLGLAS